MLARLVSRGLRRMLPGWRASFARERLAQARVFAQAGELEAAAGALELALDAQPANPLAWQRLGDVRFELALIDEAIVAYREALEREPRLLRAHSSLLFALAHREDDARALVEEHRRWGAHASTRPPAPRDAFSNLGEAGRRLR